MRALNSNDFINILKSHGFIFDRQAKGSHEIWFNSNTRKRVVVPAHGSKDLPKPTLRKMIKQSGVDPSIFR